MKKIALTVGSIVVVIVLIVILSQDKNQNSALTNNSENTQSSSVFLVSPQKEVDVVTVDRIDLSQSGFVVVQEVINEKPGQILEVSQYLDAGSHENVEIPLEESRQSRRVDISGEFPISSELVVVVYIDDGDKGFNPNLDSILEENGKILARYVESGESASRVVIVPGAQEKFNDAVVMVTYTDEGFSPSLVEINQGDTVEFVNQSRRPMWIASNRHPAHDVLPTFDQFTVSGFGEKWQYTFDQKGEWKYHDHVNARMGGVVRVK